MPSPYAKALVSVNAAAKVSGGITVPSAASVAFTGESTTGWQSQKWELYDYPAGFTAPTGWSTDANGVIFSTDVAPTAIALPANTTRWGKYALRLTVVPVGGGASLVDEQTMLSMLSPKGQRAISFNETTQFGGARKQWAGEYQANQVTVEAQLGGAGGSTPTGTGLRKVVGGTENAAASLLVNADVDPAAAIAASKLAAAGSTGQLQYNSAGAPAGTAVTTDGTNLKINGGYCSFGTGTVASAGLVRCGTAPGTIVQTVDCVALASDATFLYVGSDTSASGSQAPNVRVCASGSIGFLLGGTTNAAFNTGGLNMLVPITGGGNYGAIYPYRLGSATISGVAAGGTVTMGQAQYSTPSLVLLPGAATVAWVINGAPTGSGTYYNGTEYSVANESGFAVTFMGISIPNGSTYKVAYNSQFAGYRKVG